MPILGTVPKDKYLKYVLTVRCIVTKEIVTIPCLRREAMEDPFGFADTEKEVGMKDWEVVGISRKRKGK